MTDQVNCKPDGFQEEDPNAPKFTPGPWKAAGQNDFIVNQGGGEICQMFDKMEDNFLNSDANAKLIAAAPDLYEALENLIEQYRVINDCEVDWVPVEETPEFVAATKVLAKARGQNPENK